MEGSAKEEVIEVLGAQLVFQQDLDWELCSMSGVLQMKTDTNIPEPRFKISSFAVILFNMPTCEV